MPDAGLSAAAGAAAAGWLGMSAFDDHARLLQVRMPPPAPRLIAHRLHVHERLSHPFELTLEALCPAPGLDPQTLLGQPISVRLRQEDGAYRVWHAHVWEAGLAGGAHGVARCRLRCGPWLGFLAARMNTHLHQDRTALHTVEAIFAEYPQAHWRVDVAPETLARLRVRPQVLQYRQSDLDMVTRLLAEEGLLFHFEHFEGPQAAEQAGTPGDARHVLVITDARAPRRALRPVRFTQPRPDRNQPAPTGTVSQLVRQTQAPLASVTLAHWDERALHGQVGQAGSGALPEHYDGACGVQGGADEARRAAEQVLAASELSTLRYHGTGNARHLEAGARLRITEHPLGGAARPPEPLDLCVLSVVHWATNDMGEVAALWQDLGAPGPGPGEYRHQFEAAPASAALAPDVPARPRAPLMLPARVVGLRHSRLTTDRDLRIKVQFDFQRGERPNRAGLAYSPAVDTGANPPGHAPGDERSGSWLRMLVPVAGADWGWVLPPRIGSEVVVCFAEGDIDQPVVVGSAYGGEAPPPFAAGVDSGINHPGTISGLHSRALDDAHGSQWVHDDATGQLRLRLHNAQWGSELGLGHLIRQGLDSAQRGDWRGSGFEAVTQGWAVARAGQGLLISTEARPGTYGSAEGSQMDTQEAVARLNGARELGLRLGEAAAALGAPALASHADGQAVPRTIGLIDVSRQGRHSAEHGGLTPTVPDDHRSGAGQPVPAFAEPLVVLDSASALLAASGASTQLHASQGLSLVAQGDLHQAAGHTYAQVSGQGASLCAHAGGITAHAADGPVSLRAHAQTLRLLAAQGIAVSSVNDEIRIVAKDRLRLGAGDSGFELDGVDITFTTPGAYAQQGGAHAFLSGGGAAAALPALPAGAGQSPARWVGAQYLDLETAEPVAGAGYEIHFEGGAKLSGVLDAAGQAMHDNVQDRPVSRIVYTPRPPGPDTPHAPLEDVLR